MVRTEKNKICISSAKGPWCDPRISPWSLGCPRPALQDKFSWVPSLPTVVSAVSLDSVKHKPAGFKEDSPPALQHSHAPSAFPEARSFLAVHLPSPQPMLCRSQGFRLDNAQMKAAQGPTQRQCRPPTVLLCPWPQKADSGFHPEQNPFQLSGTLRCGLSRHSLELRDPRVLPGRSTLLPARQPPSRGTGGGGVSSCQAHGPLLNLQPLQYSGPSRPLTGPRDTTQAGQCCPEPRRQGALLSLKILHQEPRHAYFEYKKRFCCSSPAVRRHSALSIVSGVTLVPRSGRGRLKSFPTRE